MSTYRVAIDIGGTFTDVCIMSDEDRSIRVTKVPSTPQNPIEGFMAGLARGEVDLRKVSLLSHGTTVATNALITRRLPRTVMICTRGFRDILEIRRSDKEDLWDTYKDVARPYIPRRDRLEVTERIDATGKVVTAFDEEDARRIARVIKKRDVAAVAVCFMNAFTNPAHELRMKAILAEECPGLPVSTSSETLPEIFEHERFSTTVVNAALAPVAGDYCRNLNDRLRSEGYNRDLLLLHSGGGVMTAKGARQFAARLAGSGIAAGAIASRYIASQCGFPNSIGLDMGGTSCDVSLASEGKVRVTKDWYIEFGYPIRFPAIELLTIGAGGGSHAWIDDAGSLRNGPQSAGANPGPACYGKGNSIPTNTDANVVLGRQGTSLAGGHLTLDSKLSYSAVAKSVAEPLGMEVHQAANAIIRVANANMADAVRLISITRGYDPRDFALVAFGGAGALHGAEIARDLSIPAVIVPPNPGVTSAMGCLLVDVQHDLSQTFIGQASKTDVAALEALFAKIEDDAWELLKDDGVDRKDVILERTIDMMYQGQWRSLAVSVGREIGSMEAVIDAFHTLHEREYNFRRDDAPVDIYRINLSAIGVTPKAEMAEHQLVDFPPQPKEHRTTWFDGKAYADTPIYQREEMKAGQKVAGPAIIEQFDSTTVVIPGSTAEIDRFLNIIIRFEA
jgi:N-methylhydantoinase A